MRRFSQIALSSVSFVAMAAASPAVAGAAAQTPAPAPLPEQCANIQDEAAKQACATAATQNDPLANSGEQESAPTQGGAASAESTPGGGEIVVTGSRLRRDERTSADPVTIIDPNVENREGRLDTADILQSSPLAAGSTQITSAISSNFVINGGEGVQTISLRGLGANRTLVLLNGRRAGPAGTRGGVSSFDLNVIPQDAIQSVEILKTGASSIYGSDAIAGVVNLITKKDLRGLDVRGFVSAPEESGGQQYSLAGTYGLGLGDRGHLMVGVNFNRLKELDRGDRGFLGCEEEFVTNEDSGARSDPIDPRSGKPYCGAFLNNGIQLFDFGLMRSNNLLGPILPDATPPNGARRPITFIQFDPTLGQYLSGTDTSGRFFTTSPTNPTQFRAPAGFFPTGAHQATALALQNNFDQRVLDDSIFPETKRYTVFAEAGYDLTDNVSLYFEGLHNRRKTKTEASRQLFFFQFPGVGETIYSEVYGAYYLPYFFCDPSVTPGCQDAQGDPINAGFTGGALMRPVVWAPFDSSTDVKYFRGLGGIRANLDNVLPHGFADFYFQHSRSDGDYSRQIIFRDAIEFGVAEFRTQTCAGTVTAIRGVPCIDINYTDPRVLQGFYTPEEKAFLFGVDHGNTLYKQNTAELTFGGDVFELPGGSLKFALGGQYRTDQIRDRPGENTLADNIWGSTTSGITAGKLRTIEAFGEVEAPLFRDVPGIHELTLNGAARVTSTRAERRSDGLSDSDKGNWTYKVAANYSPIRPVRLRATYGTSFRSPALFEQFLADESGFLAQTAVDPCIRYENSDNAELQANCAAAGVPEGYVGGSESAETFAGGGIGVLDPETSKALTLSAIFTPDGWLWSGGQFSFAVDYIHIKVRDQVTQLGAGNIVQGCYLSDSFPNDPLCDLFVRAPEGAPNEFTITEIHDPYINIDTQNNKSLDFTTRFRQDLGNMGKLSILGQLTYQLKDKFKLFQGTTANFNGEAGDPKWVGDLNVSWAKDPYTITYGLQVISKTNDIDNLEDVGGSQLTENNCLATNAAFALRGGPYCPRYKLPRVAYHSLSAEIQATENYSFLIGVANMFDKKPPRVSTVGAPISAFGQVPLLGSYYDYYGRRMFVSFKARLGDMLGL